MAKKSKKMFSCKECPYTTNQSSHFKQHSMIHTGEKPFACTECEYVTNRADSLKKHILTHTGAKPYLCSWCNYTASQKSHLNQHMLTHKSKKLEFSCSVCEFVTTQSTYLKQHMKIHSGGNLNSRSENDSITDHGTSLENHLTSDQQLSCTECDYVGEQANDLKLHMMEHSGSNQLSSTESSTINLATDFESQESEKQHSCTYCDFRTNKSKMLRRHLARHVNEKPYACDECDFKTKHIYSLKRHMTMHNIGKHFLLQNGPTEWTT